jgi:hypothetical protein
MTEEAEEQIFVFDSDKAAQRVSRLWADLGERIATAVVGFEGDDPVDAIRWACCAEACFWKATGEADTHDVKDVLALPPLSQGRSHG